MDKILTPDSPNSPNVATKNADSWNEHWSDYAKSAEDNPAQKYRFQLVTQLLQQENRRSPFQHLVDLGSGQGDLLKQFANFFPDKKMLGVELSEVGIKIAQQKNPKAQFVQQNLLQTDSLHPPFAAWAEVGVCSEVLEHVDGPQLFLQNAAFYLKKGARLIVTVPGGIRTPFDHYIGHRQHFTKTSFTQMIAPTPFQLVHLYRTGFPFFNLYKMVVFLRGKKVIEDVAQKENTSASFLSRLVMKIFDGLFQFNLKDSLWGWQIVAVLEKK